MPIKITLPRAKKTVVIEDFDSLEDMLFASSKEHLEKPAASLLMFRRIIAYAELIGRDIFDSENIYESLRTSMDIYNSVTEHEPVEPTEIESFIENRIKEDSFNKVYSPLIEEIVSEIFKLFASGAVAHEEDFVSIKSSEFEFTGAVTA